MTEQNQPESQESTSEESTGKGRVKLKRLNVNKQTIEELADDEANRVKGGRLGEEALPGLPDERMEAFPRNIPPPAGP